jgi:hypothetical protein
MSDHALTTPRGPLAIVLAQYGVSATRPMRLRVGRYEPFPQRRTQVPVAAGRRRHEEDACFARSR